MYVKNLKRVSFLSHILEELVEARRLNDFLEEESELFMEGIFRLLDQPEFRDAQKMRILLRAFDERDEFLEIFARDLDQEGVQIHIGRENHLGELEDVSFVVKDWYLGGAPIGGVAVVGPTRMNYGRIVSVVDFVADSMTEAVKRF
jgi:heat-inducible transcriptional repressor